MKSLTKSIFIILCISLLGSAQLFGQKWSEEQQEVWQALENWFALNENNDAEGIKALIHKDFVGWGWDLYATYDHAHMQKWADHMIPKGTKPIFHSLKPMEILVIGDVAVIHFYGFFLKMVGGKETVEQRQFTNVWKKEGGKWLLIAGTGSVLSTK
jgi:ketosteroid isomerase-like protein